ncbi:MAG: hypothetical protein K0Q93_3146, partial [Nocardioidaceae bacterium]|nr:hypothetical protein [Nocardioidaceae bacterium]
GAAVERLLADREVAARPVLHAQLDGGLVCVAAAGYSGPSPCSAADSTRSISVPSCGWRSGLRILRRGIPGCRTG